MRPKTLAKVADLALGGESFDLCLANFLDSFYSDPTPDALLPEPELLAPRLGGTGQIQDAYLAATAEQLAIGSQFVIPEWVEAETRKLHRPWFASSLGALRAVLISESPGAFRARNLFISENALTRA